ncbi:MAG: exo-alpha-sialidase [Ignavibacteriales bacterium]|nr:MAG: T9SS type A sorting domain-containing protein [Ignavibacteriaceae bacterium]MBW7873141.1 exo-alpha-sialidase [Ignavibacteria bacterium]MCZ2142783.1 exo-alpha-sialidase [Ignavibacteriales bacterium]OQY75392.1 MAG: hypothetical protein B6D45_05705 [Ignavibacteriales bacterium UTCHB3]MBV6443877.1 hypothetical protein [Ignavibacteriaceae bacterium]
MKYFFVLLTILVISVPAQVNFSPVVNLSNTMNATSDYESIYADGSNFYVVWGDNGAIMFKKSMNCGVSWGPNIKIFEEESIAGWPVLCASGQNLVVLYHNNGNAGYVIQCQRSTNGGSSWSLPAVISTQGGNTSITPKITFDGSVLYAVWEQRPQKYQIYFSKSTDMGVNWSTPVNISNTSVDSRWAQIKWEGGRLHCVWLDSPTYPDHDIAYIYSDDGGASWSPYRKLTDDPLPQTRVCLQTFGNSVYIASQDMYQINFSDIGFMKSTDRGATWSAPVNITNNSGNSSFADLAVAEEPNGAHRIYMAWFDNTHSAPNYDNSDIYFSMSTNSGDTWSQFVNLSNNPDNSYQGRIALRRFPGSDSLFVVWYDYSTGNAEILGRQGVYGYTVPVELISFTVLGSENGADLGSGAGSGRWIDSSPILSWRTATETNNSRFEIFRIVGDKKEMIGTVAGAGTSTAPSDYLFEDKSGGFGKILYHLWSVDYDGTRHFLGEAAFDQEAIPDFELYQNYPNPFNPETVIRYTLPTTGFVKGVVYDILGKETAVLLEGVQTAGRHELKFSAADLPSGVYFFRLQAGDFSSAVKMVVSK